MILQGIPELDWSMIAGSGFVAGVLFLALVERLRRTFATRQELDVLKEKCRTLEKRCRQAAGAARAAHQRAMTVQVEQKHQAERVAYHVVQPLERITAKLDALGEAQASQSLALEYLERRLDRVEANADSAPGTPTRAA
jgi:hypothetical protein